MEFQTVANILVAGAVAHALHSLMEPVNIRLKVKRLAAYINKQTPPKIPQGIDTRPKALGLAFGILTVFFVLAYLIAAMLDPAPRTAMWFALLLMAIVEIINTISIDRYHVEIERITTRFKK